MKFADNFFNFDFHSSVKSGYKIINILPTYLKQKKFKKIGFVVDYNLFQNQIIIKNIINKCEKSFEKIIIHFYKEKFEPTYQYLDNVKMEFKKKRNPLVDCIVGIGGGSAIDLAKGIATLVTNHGRAINYRGFPTSLKKSIPIIAIPSTVGTGTELAFNAVFTDEISNIKLGINTPNNYPILALLDPLIASTAPKSTVINSAIGALIRSLETFVTPKASPVSRIFSKESFKMIIHSLPKVINNSKDIEHWSQMQWAAYYSMAALSNSSSGPAGAISYYLSTNFKIPQGLGYGISGLKFATYYHKKKYYGYGKILDNNSLSSEKISSEYVISKVEKLFKKLGVPNTFNKFGVSKNNSKELFNYCTTVAKNSFSNGPLKLNNSEIRKIIIELVE